MGSKKWDGKVRMRISSSYLIIVKKYHHRIRKVAWWFRVSGKWNNTTSRIKESGTIQNLMLSENVETLSHTYLMQKK